MTKLSKKRVGIITLASVLTIVTAVAFAGMPVFPTMPSGETTAGSGSEMDKKAVILMVNTSTAQVMGTVRLIDAENSAIVPIIESGRTLIPVRFLSEAFGADVKWDAKAKQIAITAGNTTAELTLDSKTMIVNGKVLSLHVPAKIVNGRTLVPLRAFVETVLSKQVEYNNGLIYISDTKVSLDDMKVAILSGILKGEGVSGPTAIGTGGPAGGGLGGASMDTSAINKKYLDIPYASASTAQKLDIYIPNTGAGPFPVIIAIHGGAFKMGNKTGGDVAPMLKGVEHGYAVVSVDYRLSGEAVFPAAVSDVKAAIRFIRANAALYNLNPDKIATWGDSAGGNLAAITGTTGGTDELYDEALGNAGVSDKVTAVVDWFGPLSFLEMDSQFETAGIIPSMGKTSSATSPETQYIGQLITEVPDVVAKANPSTYISDDDPVFLIQHGTADGNVPTQQSKDFATALEKVIGSDKVQLILLEGAGHGGDKFNSEDNMKVVFTFLDKYMK